MADGIPSEQEIRAELHRYRTGEGEPKCQVCGNWGPPYETYEDAGMCLKCWIAAQYDVDGSTDGRNG